MAEARRKLMTQRKSGMTEAGRANGDDDDVAACLETQLQQLDKQMQAKMDYHINIIQHALPYKTWVRFKLDSDPTLERAAPRKDGQACATTNSGAFLQRSSHNAHATWHNACEMLPHAMLLCIQQPSHNLVASLLAGAGRARNGGVSGGDNGQEANDEATTGVVAAKKRRTGVEVDGRLQGCSRDLVYFKPLGGCTPMHDQCMLHTFIKQWLEYS